MVFLTVTVNVNAAISYEFVSATSLHFDVIHCDAAAITTHHRVVAFL